MPSENNSKSDTSRGGQHEHDESTTKKITSNEGTAKEPKLIEVHSLFVDDSDDPSRYSVAMGNIESIDNNTKHQGQLDPLTDSKNTKRRKDIEEVEDEDHDTDNVTIAGNDQSGGCADADGDNGAKVKGPDDENLSSADQNNGDIVLENNGNVNNNKQTAEGAKHGDNLVIESDGTYEIDGRKTEEDVVITVASKDDVDAASTYSLFMEKDFRYYFQHPFSRLFIAYFVVFCNFLIYAEDPVAHSRKECYIPMIGNDVAFVLTRYPPNAWSVLKVIFWLIGMVVGMFVGKLFVHKYLFNRMFRLRMFCDSQGSWMIMFLVSLITVFIMSLLYNLFLLIGGDSTIPYRISDLMGVNNDFFMKVAACGTWCGDFFTAWMVTDIMLQEKLYPNWARPIRKWWKKGWNRIVLFWIVVLVTSFVVIFVIATDYIQWDKLNRDFMPTNELSRAFLASFILVMDLLIVMQDWDFPYFMSNIDIKLPGMNTAHIRFSIPKCLKRDHWDVHITGKWFNYGILFLVMLLDLNMWKNQIFYNPYDYGQYINDEGKIFTVQDDYSLENHNESQITYAFRSTTINPDTNQTYVLGDTHMNTKYFNYHIGVKAIAFFPSIISFIVFGIFIWLFGRFKPTEKDPYAGRLKKRMKKRRFSFKNFRLPWKRREEIRRKIHAVPKLLYFKRRGARGSEKVSKEIPTEGFSEQGSGIEDKQV